MKSFLYVLGVVFLVGVAIGIFIGTAFAISSVLIFWFKYLTGISL